MTTPVRNFTSDIHPFQSGNSRTVTGILEECNLPFSNTGTLDSPKTLFNDRDVTIEAHNWAHNHVFTPTWVAWRAGYIPNLQNNRPRKFYCNLVRQIASARLIQRRISTLLHWLHGNTTSPSTKALFNWNERFASTSMNFQSRGLMKNFQIFYCYLIYADSSATKESIRQLTFTTWASAVVQAAEHEYFANFSWNR